MRLCGEHAPFGAQVNKSKPVEQTPRVWSNPSILKSIRNPATSGYEIKLKTDEVTFLGVSGQPDYARVDIIFYPSEKVIELKSLKEYYYQFRMTVISYERLLDVVYADLVATYAPVRLRLVMTCSARGGISSRLTKDSDWKVCGGAEKFKDWIGQTTDW